MNNHAFYALYLLFVLIVAPVIWAYSWQFLRKHPSFQKHAPHPIGKPWDFVFSQGKSYWVKVFLKDGAVIGGKYSSNSFASSAPSEEQIYLEKSWVMNGKNDFEKEKFRSAGVLVMYSEISYIEFFSLDGEEYRSRKNA